VHASTDPLFVTIRAVATKARKSPSGICMGAEAARLQDARTGKIPWKKWGPYLSERQWA
jgi:hypothetical protein